MKKIYEAPIVEITKWQSTDVITTSVTLNTSILDVKANGDLSTATDSKDFSAFTN